MAEIIKGEQVLFGTGGSASTLLTSASVNKTSSKKEIPDGNGAFGAVVYFAIKDEVQFETYGSNSPDVGSTATLPTIIAGFVSGSVFVSSSEEIQSSEDMVKSNVSALAYQSL